MVSAAFIDQALEALLRAKFSMRHAKSKSCIDPLFELFGPLSTFYAKSKMCYAMDLVGEWVYRDLEIVRKVRNDFAHSVAVATFHLSKVVQLTEQLKAADLAVTQMTKEEAGTKEAKEMKITRKTESKHAKGNMERVRFGMSVSFIGALLYVLARVLNSDATLQEKENFVETVRSAE